MYVALVQLSGGVGSIVPENRPEYVVFIIGILIGSVIWAMVVGTICAMMTTGDPHTIAFKQQMDALNNFIAEMNIPHEMGVAARSYLRNTRELRKKLSYDQLVARLSPGLQGSMMLHMSQSTFASVWYLHGLEPDFLVQLAGRLLRIGYPPKEKASSVSLNIMMRGIAARGGDLFYSGSTWGEDMILTSHVLRDTRPATALTYIEIQVLQRVDLFEVLGHFPGAQREVLNAAMRMALKRTVILLKAHANSQRVRQNETSQAYSMLTSAFGAANGAQNGHDLGHIFRTITGSRLRDVDADGNLVEQVLPPAPLPSDSAESSESIHALGAKTVAKLSEGQQERATLQREASAIHSDVNDLKRTVGTMRTQIDDIHMMLAELAHRGRMSAGEMSLPPSPVPRANRYSKETQ